MEIVNGELQCRVNLLNCIPVAMFGTNALTPEMADFLKVSTSRQDQFTRQLAGATMTGTISDLPAGPLDGAFGIEWRKEEFSTTPDALSASGQIGGRGDPPTDNRGEFDLFEVFGEVRVPLLSGLPGAEILALEGAVRYSDYSTLGGITTWKGSIDWQINDWARFRGGFSRAIRAPNLFELFGARMTRFEGASRDPCVVTSNPTAAQKEVCIQQGVPAASVDNLPELDVGFTVLSGGNPNLQEEEADTITAGVVFMPQSVPELSIALDYFDIEVDQAITQVRGETLIQSCFETLDVNGPACQSVRRVSSGQLDFVEAPRINVSNLRVRGLDLSVNYTYELPGFLALPGNSADLDLTLVVTEQFEQSSTLLAGASKVECAGFYGGTCSDDGVRITPDFSGFLRANWGSGAAIFNAQFNLLGELELHPDAVPIQQTTISSRVYIDLNGGYTFGDNIEVYGGINNVTDKDPPALGLSAGGDSNTNVQTFDPLGRRFFIGIRVGF